MAFLEKRLALVHSNMAHTISNGQVGKTIEIDWTVNVQVVRCGMLQFLLPFKPFV